MKRIVSIALALVLAAAAYAKGTSEAPAPAAPAPAAPAALSGSVTVAAAANLSAVAESLKAAFAEKQPGVALTFVFGASGGLTTQIENGAPYQIFMSADTAFPAKLAAAGLTAGPEKVYATGKLILLSASPRDFTKGLALLTDPAVEHFAIANVETAPYGTAAMQALAAAGLWETVKPKAVFAQNIAQAVQYTTGATGLGFVNKSALYTKDLAAFTDKEGVNWIEVDPKTHAPIAQAFVVLKSAAEDQASKAFAAFLSAPEAKTVFTKAGYAVPE